MNFLGWKRNGSNGNNSTADVRQAEKEREMEQIEWELSQAAAAAATTTAASNPHSVPQASLMQQNRFGQQQGQAAAGGGHPPPPLSYEQQQQMYHHFLMMQQQQQQQTQPQQPHYPPPSSHLHLPPHFNFNPEFMAAWPASTTAGGVPMTIPQPPPPPPHHLMMMNYHQGLAAGGGLAGAAPPPVLHGFSNSPPNMLISNYGPAQPTGPNGLPGRERGNSGGRIPVPQGLSALPLNPAFLSSSQGSNNSISSQHRPSTPNALANNNINNNIINGASSPSFLHMRRPSVSSALANNIPTTSTHPASNYNNSNLSFLYQKRPSSPSVLSGGAAVAANHNNLPPHLQRRPSSPTLTTPSNLNSSGGSGLNLQQPLPQQYANTSRRPSTSSLIQSPISPSSPISPAVSYISNNGGRRPSVINNGGKSPTFNKAMNLPQRLESTQQHPYQGQLQQQQRPSFSSGTNNPIYERKNSLPNESSNSASTAVVVTSDTSSEVFSPNTPIPRPNNNGRPRSGGSSGISKKQVPPPGPLIEMDDDYKDCVQDFLAMFDEVTLENEPYLREYTESILSRWYRRIARNFSVSDAFAAAATGARRLLVNIGKEQTEASKRIELQLAIDLAQLAVEAACIAWSTAHGREEHDENVIVPGFSEQEVQEKVGKLSTSYIDRANCWTPQLAAKAGGNRMKRARRSRFISVLVENEEAGGGGSGGQAWGGKNLYNSSLTSPQKQYQQQQQHIYRQQQLQQLPNQPQQRFGSNGFMPSSPGQQMRKFGVTDRTSPGAAATPDRMTDTASSSSNADTNSTSPLVNHRFNWATPNKKPQQAGDGSSNNGKVSGTKSSTQTSVFAVLKSKSEKLLRLRKNLNNNTSSSENLSPPATPAPKKPSIVDENAPPNANNWVGRTGQLQIQQQQQQQQTAATQFRRRKASNDLLSPPLSPSGVVTEGDAIKINKGRRGSAEALLKDLLLECETFMRE